MLVHQVTAHENPGVFERERKENKKNITLPLVEKENIQSLLHNRSYSGCCDSAGLTVKSIELSRYLTKGAPQPTKAAPLYY